MTQKLHILVVDDEPSVSASILWALKPFGHTTKVVTDGERALASFAADPTIDLVVTDHSMPRMSGLELVRLLRETGYHGKILVLSAHLSHRNLTAYGSLGVNAMLPKPFDVDALRKTIDELFQDLPPLYEKNTTDKSNVPRDRGNCLRAAPQSNARAETVADRARGGRP